MVLVDTSIWVDVFRDSTGRRQATLTAVIGDDDLVLSRFHELEMLQGCRDEAEWTLLKGYLDAQDYLELSGESWGEAARIFFDLRRSGRKVRSPIDCCIAQIALDHGVLLLHRDRDFETIATVRPLQQLRLAWS
jgi:predicted nucleic acid-binding protein